MKTHRSRARSLIPAAAIFLGSFIPIALAAGSARAPDLSTPDKALAVFIKALDDGDAGRLDSVTTGDAKQQEWVHALAAQLAGFKELEAALAKKYGPAYAGTDAGKEITDQIDEARDDDLRADLKKAKLGPTKGDVAILVLDEAAPDDRQGRLVRAAGGWKVDLDSLTQYASGGDVPVLQAMAKAAAGLARDVGSGKFASLDETARAVEERLTAAAESVAKKSAPAPTGAAPGKAPAPSKQR